MRRLESRGFASYKIDYNDRGSLSLSAETWFQRAYVETGNGCGDGHKSQQLTRQKAYIRPARLSTNRFEFESCISRQT
jgi:hypothetical protein